MCVYNFNVNVFFLNTSLSLRSLDLVYWGYTFLVEKLLLMRLRLPSTQKRSFLNMLFRIKAFFKKLNHIRFAYAAETEASEDENGTTHSQMTLVDFFRNVSAFSSVVHTDHTDVFSFWSISFLVNLNEAQYFHPH